MLFSPSRNPESYSDLLSRSLNLYGYTFRRIFFLSLLCTVIVFTPRIICIITQQNILVDISQWQQYLLLYVVVYIASLWIVSAMFWRMNNAVKHKHETYFADFKIVHQRFLKVLVAAILIFFMSLMVYLTFLGLYNILLNFNLHNYIKDLILLFVVIQCCVSILIATLVYFYFPLLIIENSHVLNSLRESISLVWRNVWRVLVFQITPWLVYLICLIILKSVFHIYLLPMAWPFIWGATFVHMLLFALFFPWGISALLVQLRDLELRKAITLKK